MDKSANSLCFLLALACCTCAGEIKPSEPNSTIRKVLGTIDKSAIDSMKSDTLHCMDREDSIRLAAYNKEFETHIFSKARCTYSVQIFHARSHRLTILTLMDFRKNRVPELRLVMERHKTPSFRSKIFNRYRWHLRDSTLAILESLYSPDDPWFEKLDSILSLPER